MVIGCLSYLSSEEWRRLAGRCSDEAARACGGGEAEAEADAAGGTRPAGRRRRGKSRRPSPWGVRDEDAPVGSLSRPRRASPGLRRRHLRPGGRARAPTKRKTTLPATPAAPSTPAPAPVPPPTMLRASRQDPTPEGAHRPGHRPGQAPRPAHDQRLLDRLPRHPGPGAVRGVARSGHQQARYVALDCIAARRRTEIRGLRFLPTRDGLDVETRPGTFVSQGHQDQFVAEMVEWNTDPQRKFLVNGEEHPFIDFCRQSKARASVKENQELDWAVVIIGQYFGTDAAWTNANGESLHFEDLLRKELDESVDQASCGGTHRLFDLTWVYHLHLQREQPDPRASGKRWPTRRPITRRMLAKRCRMRTPLSRPVYSVGSDDARTS